MGLLHQQNYWSRSYLNGFRLSKLKTLCRDLIFKLSVCSALVLCRSQLEEQLQESRRAEGDNAINLALAEEIQSLQERQTELEAEAQELREQNDLLEFRILELDDGVCAHSCSSFHFKVGNVIWVSIVVVGGLALFQLLWAATTIMYGSKHNKHKRKIQNYF